MPETTDTPEEPSLSLFLGYLLNTLQCMHTCVSELKPIFLTGYLHTWEMLESYQIQMRACQLLETGFEY